MPMPRPGMGPRSSRRFANRVWTSPAYKKARQEHTFREPKALVVARDSPMSTSCADEIVKLQCAHVILPSTLDEASREDLLQCLWCRSVAALIGCLDTFASGEEAASSIVQAARASGTSLFLLLDRMHFLWASEAFVAAVHDSGLNICPCPDGDNVFLSSCTLPTWPVQEDRLTALEVAGRLSCLSVGTSQDKSGSLRSLLNRDNPFVASRPPICDGAGSVSSADLTPLRLSWNGVPPLTCLNGSLAT